MPLYAGDMLPPGEKAASVYCDKGEGGGVRERNGEEEGRE
jgi:hypothetical protein